MMTVISEKWVGTRAKKRPLLNVVPNSQSFTAAFISGERAWMATLKVGWRAAVTLPFCCDSAGA